MTLRAQNLIGAVMGGAAGVLIVAVLSLGSSTTQESPLSENAVSVIVAGDFFWGRHIENTLKKTGKGYDYLVEESARFSSAADISFCNLETVVADRSVTLEPLPKRWILRSDASGISTLIKSGFDVVSLANNHALDFGAKGLSQTLKHLSRAKIEHVGLVENGAPQKPVIIERRGLKIGFLAYADAQTPYAYEKLAAEFPTRPAVAMEAKMAADIKRLRTQVDAVVVSMHWGIETHTHRDKRQVQLGRFLVNAGADLVVGHHPHVQQEVEKYRKGIILYSIGNYVFDQYTRDTTRQARLYRVRLSKTGPVNVEFMPLEILAWDWKVIPRAKRFAPVSL